MSTLAKLKSATSIKDFAPMLGYSASTMAYILYKLPADQKYTVFEVPKKAGGTRTISAPTEQLKVLQKHLANFLYQCVSELTETGEMRALSHGFRHRRSIITNARLHQRRRYVLNLDLKDFFPTFNFGRVRGYFMKDRRFALAPNVATLIAQIACFDDGLPQGSPCSPIIADLVAGVLDGRLAKMAKAYTVTYSRYADDLTFSTSQHEFPPQLAVPDPTVEGQWNLGSELVSRITGAGFVINDAKTRMQCRGSRQIVTGLTVNRKVNVQRDYYKLARAMCRSLLTTGKYKYPDPEEAESLRPLAGILSHIHLVKDKADLRDEVDKRKEPTAFRRLYADFNFYRLFVVPERPLIICEGKTDNIYLKLALPRLTAFHPALGGFDGPKFVSKLAFFRYSNLAHRLLNMGGGTGGITQFLANYKDTISRFGHKPMANPVIIVADNDSGGESIRKAANGCFKTSIPASPTDAFYHLVDNIYLVFTPLKADGGGTCIEDMFDPELLKTELQGKKLNLHKEHGADGEYGKMAFAESVVRPNAKDIEFDGFTPLFERISQAIAAHSAKPTPLA